MHVKHCLASGHVGVDHRAVTILSDSLDARNLRGDKDEPSKEESICRLVKRCDVPFGNHQHMCWGLRVDVAKRNAVVGFVDDVDGDIPSNDPAEETFVAHLAIPLARVQSRSARPRRRPWLRFRSVT